MIMGIMVSCHMFEDNTDMDTVKIEFDKQEMSVYVGGINSVQIKVDPVDILTKYEVQWSVSRPDLGTIYESSKRGCTVAGKMPGDVILYATINNAQASMVFHVLDNDTIK